MPSPPLHDTLTSLGADLIPFGPPLPVRDEPLQIAAEFPDLGGYETEYAAIRRHVGLMHLPQRAVVQLTGSDVKPFLHNLVTQDVNTMKGGDTRRSFQLNHKGRILADLIIHHGDESTWLETDVFDVPPLIGLLESKLFAEDVTIEDWTDQRTFLSVLGPAAVALLQTLESQPQSEPRRVVAAAVAMPGTHHVAELRGVRCTCYHWHDAADPELRLAIPTKHADDLYQALLDAAGFDPRKAAEPDAEWARQRRESLRGRPVGWLAYNTARIEQSTPLFHLDFGPDSLPGETDLLDSRVSFTKGCYLGQEIVARMKNLGHPKRLLRKLVYPGPSLPVAGTQVFAPDDSANPIGGITSSTLSPLLGGNALALATLKWGRHPVGTTLTTPIEGRLVEATVEAI